MIANLIRNYWNYEYVFVLFALVCIKFLKFAANKIVMKRQILQCIEDMQTIVTEGRYSLDAQVRAYDLLEVLAGLYDGVPLPEEIAEVASRFHNVYDANSETLSDLFDPEALSAEAAQRLKPLEDACNEARFQAAAAASLHEFAKEVFDIWQNCGVFARRRALKELRERAGFKLESHRIGNYVAKTFDLQNAAAASFAQAQQAVYKSNVAYKIKPGLYGLISKHL
jgi:hypothetical protein